MKKLNFSLLGFIPLILVLVIGNFIINYSVERESNEDWEFLLNGDNLMEWEIKIKNHDFGENFNNTFKVENNSIKVSYENYDSFEEKFGHIFFTKKKFKNYHLSLEYKFSGDHLNGAPSWSIKNSGIMLHCQDPKTMLIDQDFPVSAEVQLLGGLGQDERTTANICSPGTDVDINSKLAKQHCNNSNSKTYHNDEWVKVEVMVYSNLLVKHIVEGDTVLSYSNIKIGGNKVPSNYLSKVGEPLKEGYISLQSEGHPVEFRNIKIKELNSIK
tara:strand:+ start:3873 stop:4685 length:813 start_codon:yes stop_codon:yes gene_type:complete